MVKAKTQFVCSECGYTSGKWSGKCPSCNEWNTLVEEVVQAAPAGKGKVICAPARIVTFDKIPLESEKRFSTGIGEFDRVLGGGVVPGGVCLAGGEPGIGKSTLFLQVAKLLCAYGNVLYVSGEESPAQIKMRAQRLGVADHIYLMAETEVGSILAGVEELKPKFLILDSIQTLYDANLSSAPGSVAQVRGCASRITQAAKRMGIATFIIGHVTKEGAIAGPRVLEHLVDTVLYFEGERTSNLRILRAVKNRFGSTDEIGVFEMRDMGMMEVKNPTMLFEGDFADDLSGVSIFAATQGTRPMLLEIQALCAHTQLNIPRRLCSGLDNNRLYMICAVLEKKIGLKLYNEDIFVNVAGGIKVKEYAADMAMAMSIVSSLRNLPIPRDTAFIGEIGLSGEIRHVSQLSRRVNECAKMGVRRVFVPKYSIEAGMDRNIKVEGVGTLSDVLARAF
ncbi:DNA repair protein RadA [Christensenella timonensis]|uniref:DNA repair protein RadA n=1 Tax=Christensenella timonensis TaxID=1816678 RepID=UPI00083651C7|nr:DNA repair protein RadA [Christensenella timonensis]